MNQTRSKRAAKRFFRKVLGQSHVSHPRVITVDKNASYPPAIDDLKHNKLLFQRCQYRASKYRTIESSKIIDLSNDELG